MIRTHKKIASPIIIKTSIDKFVFYVWIWSNWTAINVALYDLKYVVVLRLNVPVNNFSVMSGRSHRFLGN